jgi:hypothetical protein
LASPFRVPRWSSNCWNKQYLDSPPRPVTKDRPNRETAPSAAETPVDQTRANLAEGCRLVYNNPS